MKNFLLCTVVMGSLATEVAYSQQRMIVGDTSDVTRTTSGGVCLMGGGADNDDAIRWMISKSGGGDFVVIRSAGTDAYNSYIFGLGTVNSVETIVINSRTMANNADVERRLRGAEALFITGGDQATYQEYWKDTKVEDAINYLINVKKVPVGGTSAGCAIQGQYYFSAEITTIQSADALANPYNTNITLRTDFINNPVLANTITDTHYNNPDRRGRHTTFIARLWKDFPSGINTKGIGVYEATAVCIDADTRIARVFGSSAYEDYAYFYKIESNSLPTTVQAGTPLTWNNGNLGVRILKIRGDETGSTTFNLNDWTTVSGTRAQWGRIIVQNGVLSEVLDGSGGGGGSSSYCSVTGNVTNEWIRTVTFDGQTNNSNGGSTNGYGNFTTITWDAVKGKNTSITLTPGFRSSSYTERWAVYIDYNQDNDFDDSGELVASGQGSAAITVNTTISTTPATNSTTRMRVIMSYNTITGPCANVSYGEIEDYTLRFVEPTATCNVPSGLSASSITQTSATLSWSAVSGASSYTVQYKPTTSSTWTTISNVTSTSTSVSGLAAGTTYEFQVRTNCGSSSSAFSASANFTTSASSGGSYCAASSTNANNEWIRYVRLNTINQTSGASTYTDYTATTHNVRRGTTYTMELRPGFSSSTAYDVYWRVYIDYNRDGDFLDANEQVYQNFSRRDLSFSITINSTASLGTTRMRVALSYNSYPASCGTFNFGEVEDYSLNICSTCRDEAEESVSTLTAQPLELYPNPTNGEVKISFSSDTEENVSVTVYDLAGAVVENFSTTAQVGQNVISKNLSALTAGTYVVKAVKGSEVLTSKLFITK
ncbi:MAG: GEVED domain-containing protein [Cytophagales bacterium]|nr:GEVED domain-containing protein [Cytophagales bacterium]MDW8385020.1 GEVED domain-containing protein [Flammeovirgaceae bacterium]